MSEFPSPGNLLSAPKNWTRVRLKFAVDCINEKVDFAGDGEYVALENISSWTSLRLTSEAPLEPSSQTNRFQSGDVLFGKLRPYLAKVLLANFDGYASSECLVLRGKAVLPEFVRYWCLSKDFIELVDGSTFGSKMPRADWDFIGNTVALIPPLPIQRAIAAHLDRETAKIDTLIAKKRELIAKLKEQRSALISRTVTRGLPPDAAKAAGLDPNPPMKDSGVEWLGEVPVHWNCVQLKRLITFMTSGSRGWAEYYADSGSVFVRIGNLTRDSLNVDMSDIQYVVPPLGAEGERTSVQPGDLLISITAYLGSVAIAPVDFADGYVSQHIALARPAAKHLWPRFGGYCVLSEPVQVQLNAQGYGGTKVQLSLGDVLSLWLPAPPIDEQRLISEFLDSQAEALALLMAKVETAITRLTEYRAALITAAVTGQLAIASAR